MDIDLENPLYAYMFGFLQADGHLYQGTNTRGKLILELMVTDRHIIEQFAHMVPYYSSITERIRTTNFKTEHRSVVWAVFNRNFREALIRLGFPQGKKSTLVTLPSCPYSKRDYFRGLIDADGSLGMTNQELPFLSLSTSSDQICDGFCDFIYEVTGNRKIARRNNRDNIYNIVIMREAAQLAIEQIYYPGCLALARKQEKAHTALAWKRPNYLPKAPIHKLWTSEQDMFIVSHTLEESMETLRRTRQSIRMRLWRLRNR